MIKSGRHTVLLVPGDFAALCNLRPALYHLDSVVNNPFGARFAHTEIGSNLKGKLQVLRIVGFGDVEPEPGAVGSGIDIIGWSQGPSLRFEKKSMIAQMIVGVGDADRKYDPFPEFFQIPVGLRS